MRPSSVIYRAHTRADRAKREAYRFVGDFAAVSFVTSPDCVKANSASSSLPVSRLTCDPPNVASSPERDHGDYSSNILFDYKILNGGKPLMKQDCDLVFLRLMLDAVREVARSCETGAATNIIYGLSLGYKSVIFPIILISIALTIYIFFFTFK